MLNSMFDESTWHMVCFRVTNVHTVNFEFNLNHLTSHLKVMLSSASAHQSIVHALRNVHWQKHWRYIKCLGMRKGKKGKRFV